MSETLRRYHGQRDPGARRRLESLARCTADHELAEVYCTLARMLHAMEMPCDRAAAPLRELLRSTDASATPMARPIRVELARCVIGSEPEDAVTEAETLAHAVLADGPDDPCVAASLMSTVARIARRGGDVDGTLRRRTALDSARLRACPARDMVVRVLGERANLAAADGRWCEAAEDNGEAHDLRPYRADVLVNWAEAALLCPSTTPATRDAILDELDPERFDSGPARTSVAFMRWMTARSPRAGQAVLRSWDEVPAGELPLLEGVASALSPCPSGPESCAYDLLRRPKAAEDRASLRRRLGLDQASPPG